jgi:hypothetical protein
MKLKPGRGWFLLAGLIVLVSFGYFLSYSTSKLPVYGGKTFYQWATELQKAQANYSDPKRWETVEATSAAIRAIGTNALPFVMADLRAQPSLKERLLAWLAPRAKFLKLKPLSASDRWVRGIRALEVLGPLAKGNLPELVTMASLSTGYSEGALMAIGPDAIPAFTNLLAVSTFPRTGNLIGAFANSVYADRIKPEQAAVTLPYLVKVFQSADSHGRWYAASALGAVHQDPDLCVPLLFSGLNDTNSSVRESCVQSLGAFGEAASKHAEKLAQAFDGADALTRRAICSTLGNFRSAGAGSVPVLVRAVRDRDESVRVAAVVSLGQLTTAPEVSVPALSEGVHDSSRVVRIMAAQSLGSFGLQASNAIPILERACFDTDDSVRSIATNTLGRIRQER